MKPAIDRKRRMPPRKPNNGIALVPASPYVARVKAKCAIRQAIKAGGCFYSHENSYGFFLMAKIPGLARMQTVFRSIHFSHFAVLISYIAEARAEFAVLDEREAA
jgi:H+/gluconate symporter-like permease